MRQFRKFFTREITLIVMEYWHKGEYKKLHEILKGATHFNPLFIRSKNGLTDVYYDMNNPDTALQPLLDYFKNDPNEFNQLSKEFEIKQGKISGLLKNFKIESFSELFNDIADAWGYLPLWVQLGSADKNNIASAFTEKSHKLRDEFQEVEYKTGELLLSVIKNKYPKLKQYVDVISAQEIINNSVPELIELEKRKNGFIYFEGQILTQISKKEFAEKHRIIFIENLATIGELNVPDEKITDINIKLIKGKVAYSGFAKGFVRKIMGRDQIHLFKKGEILVSPMTTPDYLPAMKKASSFVTDEGGILCHAAIVARELKKPCIVGTKFATQILKDGDLVEVDADKGIVTILK